MERDTTDELIEFYANSYGPSKTLALKLLEPLRIQKLHPVPSDSMEQSVQQIETQENQQPTTTTTTSEQIKLAFNPIKSVIDKLWMKGYPLEAQKFTTQADNLQNIIVNLFEEINAKEKEEIKNVPERHGVEDFERDHNLLAKLIAHPKMTLSKILEIYPDLPYPKHFNKNALVTVLLAEWLPILAKYSRQYQIEETTNADVHDLVISLMKTITDLAQPKQKGKRKSKQAKDQVAATSMNVVSKDCS